MTKAEATAHFCWSRTSATTICAWMGRMSGLTDLIWLGERGGKGWELDGYEGRECHARNESNPSKGNKAFYRDFGPEKQKHWRGAASAEETRIPSPESWSSSSLWIQFPLPSAAYLSAAIEYWLLFWRIPAHCVALYPREWWFPRVWSLSPRPWGAGWGGECFCFPFFQFPSLCWCPSSTTNPALSPSFTPPPHRSTSTPSSITRHLLPQGSALIWSSHANPPLWWHSIVEWNWDEISRYNVEW